MSQSTASRNDVIRLFGGLSDHTILKVLESGATLGELEEVAMWIAQADDVMGNARRPLTGRPARLLDWIEGDLGFPEEEPR